MFPSCSWCVFKNIFKVSIECSMMFSKFPMCFSRLFPIAPHFTIAYPLPKVLPFSSHLWGKGEAWILIVVLLGSLPSFIFLFGNGPNKMTQLQGKKKSKRKTKLESSLFIYWRNFAKMRNSKLKFKKKSDFGATNHQKWELQLLKIAGFSIFDFWYTAKL